MFFSICNKSLENFPYHYQHQNLIINLDNGWQSIKDQHNNCIYFKGYLDDDILKTRILEIAEQEEPLFFGNFCVIKCFDKGVTIKTDRLRSFPIWYSAEQGLTNLTPLTHTCWTDSFVMITDSMQLVESKFALLQQRELSALDKNQVIEKVNQILTTKILKFTSNNYFPIKIFLSGGIDTMLLYSYFLKLGIPHQLIDYNHIDFDYFYLKNHDTLSKFWGYKQIHHWKTNCVLVTGAPGDEFTVRSPVTANMILQYHGLNILDLIDRYKNSLHYTHFNNPKYFTLWEKQRDIKYESLGQAIWNSLNLNVNDWQHWHLGNTLSYTPLRDTRLFVLIARLHKEQLVEQVMDSVIQKEIIKRNAPQLLECLSDKKNSDNSMENLTNIYCR
jgi:hypothetical protein